MGPPPASPEQKPRLRAGAAAARGFRPPRGCASCSNTRARYIRAPHKRDPLGRNPLASTSFATMAFFASAGHFFWYAGAGIDEATDIQVAKDAAVRGSGASRPWMACARLLEPRTAESGDAPDPRTTAAPSRRRQIPALWLKPEARTAAAPPEGDKSRCFGSTQKPAPPRLPSKPTDSSALRPRPENQPIMAAGPLPPESPP